MSPNIPTGKGVQNESVEPAEQGPPVELPDVVPDFVGEIHSTINDVLVSGADSIGTLISDIASNALVGEAIGVVPDIAAAIPL